MSLLGTLSAATLNVLVTSADSCRNSRKGDCRFLVIIVLS